MLKFKLKDAWGFNALSIAFDESIDTGTRL